MEKVLLLVFLTVCASAVPGTIAQSCTPLTTPYNANNLYTYPLVNQSTSPIQMTTASLVNTSLPAVKAYIVKSHNCRRTLVKPAAANMLLMQWNAEAAAGAQKHASNCVYQHNSNANRTTSQFNCGQNIAMVTGSTPMAWKTVMDMWWNEVNSCTNSTAAKCTAGAVIGHYTQMAWAKTWQIGCGWAKCASMNFYVCNYCPAGNYVGQKLYTTGTSCSACPNSCIAGKLCST